MGNVCHHILLMLTAAYTKSGSSDWAPIGPAPQLDVKLYDYIEAVVNESRFDEERTFPPTTEKQKTSSDGDTDYDWTLMAPGEVPFVAILYQATELEPAPNVIRPRTACGGILVSPDTIVTPCGCIMSFIGHVADETFVSRQKPAGVFKYDMDAVDSKYNFNNVGVNRIYVVFSQYEFDANNKDHYLDDNVRDLVTTQECYYKTDPYWTSQGSPPKKLDSRKIDSILAFWKMVPAVIYPIPGQFMPWPPVPITDIQTAVNSTDKQQKVIISGMGFDVKSKSFTFLDEFENATNFLKRGVNLIFEHLCNGTIGWPVVSKNNTVVGLTVTNRACDKWHGSILVAVFHSKVADEIAAAAGSWAKLVEQNSMRPPLYREAPWVKLVPLYEYSYEDEDSGRKRDRHTTDLAVPLKSATLTGLCSLTILVFPYFASLTSIT